MRKRLLSYLLPIAVATSMSSAWAQTPLTYENWAQGFFTHNCLGCHNASLSGEDRFGAPNDVNFDTLALIRDQLPIIRDAVSSADPYMPPSGVVWWWDRVSLAEWIDAGAPGATDTLNPVERNLVEVSRTYQSLGLYFSNPVEEQFDIRYIGFQPEWQESFEGTIHERYVSIARRNDGSVVMTSQEWFERNDDWSERNTRLIDYNPPVPILFANPDNVGETWQASVNARERYWDGWWGGEPETDSSRQESWLVTNAGIETVDNGVVLPIDALKMVLSNLSNDTSITYWYGRGLGLVRRETNAPSALAGYVREITREMNVFSTEYPLYGPFTIEAASQEWLPFVGRYYSAEYENLDYWNELEVQNIALASTDPTATPEPTATLADDPVDPPVEPSPTATLFPPGLPPEDDSTPTATQVVLASPTPTFTQGGGGPEPTADPNDPNDPNSYDHNKDQSVDSLDLLMFLQHWKEDMGKRRQ